MPNPEEQLSDQLIYRARPTVHVDGVASSVAKELLLAMRMTEHEGGLSELELRFANLANRSLGGALVFEDEAIFKFGSDVVIYSGDEQRPQAIFSGKVTAIEAEFARHGSPELVVFAEDALQRARMNRRTAMHRDVSIADLARDVAQRAGLRPVVTGFSDGIGPQMQLNESDLAFLRRILRAYDGDLQVVDAELQVAPRSEVQRSSVNLAMYGQLLRVRVTADLADQASEVTIAGWDPERGDRIAYVSRGRALGPGSGRKGAEVLTRALGERSEHIGHVAAINDTEARAMADASYDQRARRFVVLEGTSDGNPAIRVGTHVTIEGMSDRFDNVFYVTRACHRFDLSLGYLTDFEGESAYLGVA